VCHRAQFWVPFSLIFFINDIFYSVDFSTIDLYNYADDNTLSYADYDLNNNKFIDFSDRSYASSFNKMRSCGRQSKAFDKSIKIAAIYLFSSKAFFQSSIIFSKAV
jgi:hypothetical protein